MKDILSNIYSDGGEIGLYQLFKITRTISCFSVKINFRIFITLGEIRR